MKKTSNNKHRIILRYLSIAIILLLFASASVWKLFQTTIINGEAWNIKADSVLTKVYDVIPERGKLLADNGAVLAANMQFYTVRIDWSTANADTLKKYLPELADSLHAFYPDYSADTWKEKLLAGSEEIRSNGKKNTAWKLIPRLVTNKEFQRLHSFPFLKLKKSGITTERTMKRRKPFGTMAARSIGNVADSEIDKTCHGTSGLEMALDSLLYGTPGSTIKQQLNNSIVDAVDIPAIPGYDITTTINIDIQDILENELYNMCHESGAQWGTAIVMEVATGEIKAISNLEWNKGSNDFIEGRNNAVLGYEPGSVMKPISMLVALEDGAVSGPNMVWETGSVWNYCNRPVTDHTGMSSLTCEQIIARSSNIGMSKIIALGNNSKYGKNPGLFRDRLEELGFFEPFHSGIGGEQQPDIRRLGTTNGDRVALTRMAFGYATRIPPLCTLAVYNAIANDGKYVRPHLMKKLSREGEPDSIVPVSYIRPQICSPENAAKLRQMLHAVVWTPSGTAFKWLRDSTVHVAGKTGTAFVTKNGQYSEECRRFAFCGYFPEESPKYSCMVLLMGASGCAAATSGMVMKNVALKMYARGMLGNEAEYVLNNTKGSDKKARLFSNGANTLKEQLTINKAVVLRQPKQPAQGVPDVKGMCVRDAIDTMERAGLNVRIKGTGYVASQSLAPGSPVAAGTTVQLSLVH
ncbi:MAG: transpeptidase family protein [Muribaculaceae bacterium]|nr:transpeptidase family protein [Muribaculaceae bacterium]